ncbi:MAG TPA: hypothetical protein PL187_18000 [Caldilinea sp.]|nr:hypothetical protein [Anaerolineales bacterium]HRA67928.1 hypothetical protein [Caldilinea sp.]
MRYIVTGGILAATLGWLVMSYLPSAAAALPQMAFDGAAAPWLLPWLAGLSLLVFLVIQLDLVRATLRWYRPSATPAISQALVEFSLPRGQELFWTVLPVLGTVILALWLMIVS